MLVLGGGDGLALREILKYPSVEHVTLVDLDPEMTRLSNRFPLLAELNQQSFDDPRVQVINADAFIWVEQTTDEPLRRCDRRLSRSEHVRARQALHDAFLSPAANAIDARARPCSVQSTSPMFARNSYWCIIRTLEAAGLRRQAVLHGRAEFWPLGLRARALVAVRECREIRRPACSFLDEQTLAAMFTLSKDIEPVPVEINRLDNQALVRYYEGEWNAFSKRDVHLTVAKFLPPSSAFRSRSLRVDAIVEPAVAARRDRRARRTCSVIACATAARSKCPQDAWTNVPVVIVGGGVAGLAAAWRLQNSGFTDFVLLELESAPGGTSRSGSNRLDLLPVGRALHSRADEREHRAHLAARRDGRARRQGHRRRARSSREQFLCRDPEERIFYKGRWYEGLYLHAGAGADDEQQMQKFNAEMRSLGRVARREGTARVHASRVGVFRRCGSDGARSHLDGRVDGSAAASRVRDCAGGSNYACRDDYGMTLDHTSAWAGLFYFCARVLKPGVESQSLITWPEGNGRLVNHLFEKARTQVQLDRAATELVPGENGCEVINGRSETARNPAAFARNA